MLNILNSLNSLMNNPMQFLIQNGLNVPQGIANNPEQIVQHLLNSGQITQQQVNQAVQMRDTNPMFNQFR